MRGREARPAVYILASGRRVTLYVGVTSNLVQRVWQHRNDVADGFSRRHGVHLLAYFEMHERMENAIARQKQIKKWRRLWKLELIEKFNPNWNDLYETICGDHNILLFNARDFHHSTTQATENNAVIPVKAGIHFFAVRQDGLSAGTLKVRPTKIGFPLSRE